MSTNDIPHIGSTPPNYDLAIIGGGLAGLSLSIQMATKGYRVILFEKETYPFHKVCGEYISRESWDFLVGLGLALEDWSLPGIDQLQVSSPGGKMLQQPLPLGGFGISRYKLDAALAQLAKKAGVTLLENTKVNAVEFVQDTFTVQHQQGTDTARLVAGSFGKKSNLDIKWKRPFVAATRNGLNNYVGIKYHAKIDFPVNTIALHNFRDGYCGVVKIEDDRYCICYLTTAKQLQRHSSIRAMEQAVLCKNPHLERIWSHCEWLYDTPLTIAQISFSKKSQVEQHVLLLGDAAGMITPLCGNGMSMALHGSQIASGIIDAFFNHRISRGEMEKKWIAQWQLHFSKRLNTGRIIQQLFGKNHMTGLLITLSKPFPAFTRWLIRQTHGKKF